MTMRTNWGAEMPLTIATLTRMVALGTVMTIFAGSALARSDKIWPVEGNLVGEIKNGEEKKAKDVSGIACMETSGFPRHCLIVDDNTQIAQSVTHGSKLKPEALLPLKNKGTKLRVLLLLDGAKEGGPRTVKIKSPDSVEPKRSDPQGNRVKGLCGEEAFEEVVVPSCGFSFEAQ